MQNPSPSFNPRLDSFTKSYSDPLPLSKAARELEAIPPSSPLHRITRTASEATKFLSSAVSNYAAANLPNLSTVQNIFNQAESAPQISFTQEPSNRHQQECDRIASTYKAGGEKEIKTLPQAEQDAILKSLAILQSDDQDKIPKTFKLLTNIMPRNWDDLQKATHAGKLIKFLEQKNDLDLTDAGATEKIVLQARALLGTDAVVYSKGVITGTDISSNSKVSIPRAAYFQAGKDLCQRLTNSLFNTMVAMSTQLEKGSLRNATEPLGVNQFGKDLYRCDSLQLTYQGSGKIIGFQPQVHPDTTMRTTKDSTVALEEKLILHGTRALTDFVGRTNLPLVSAIMGITNQSLGNTCGYSLKSQADPDLLVDTAIGFPSPNFSSPTHSSYELEKIGPEENPDYFILKFNFEAHSTLFLQKQEEGGVAFVQTDPQSDVQFTDSFSVKITPNSKFNPTQPTTAENFPCSLEVLDFTNIYTTRYSRALGGRKAMTS